MVDYQRAAVECLSELDIVHSTYRIVENDLEVFGKEADILDSNMWHSIDSVLDQLWDDLEFGIVDILCSRNPVIIGREQSIDWSDLAQNLLAWLFFSRNLGPQHPATMLVLLCEAMRCGYHGQDSMHTKLPEIFLAIRSIPFPDTFVPHALEASVDLARLVATPITPGATLEGDLFLPGSSDYGEDEVSKYFNILSSQPLSLSLVDNDDVYLRSWIVDWETRTKRFLLNHPASSFSASETLDTEQLSVSYEQPPGTVAARLMRCKGFIVDAVRRTSDYLPPRRHCDHYNVNDHCLFFANWYDFAKEHSNRAENDLLLEYADTIQARGCGHLWEDADITPQDRIQKARAFLDFLSDEDADEADITNSIRLFHAACFPSHDRRFAITNKGHFCLVPKNTQSGDLVCIPHNSRVPYIFRPRMEGHGFINIGETFVHGIMHGHKSELKGREETEFVLH
ncbi:unnamed protein product [Alternaria burnsii]|nr:unnamed protein product [Alternaria burnsii]